MEYLHIKNIHNRNSIVIKIAFVAFLLNFVWEMLQMPLFSDNDFSLITNTYCFLASIGDVLLVYIIYFAGVFLLKDYKWFYFWNIEKIALVILLGLILSVAGELTAIKLNLWNYSNLMPKLVSGSVGVSPVLQMIILPFLTFQIVSLLIKSNNKK